MTRLLIVDAAVAALTLPAVAMGSSSGSITTATVDPTWTTGTMTGTVNVDPGLTGPLIWIMVQPSEYSCTGDEWADSDRATVRLPVTIPISNGMATINLVDQKLPSGTFGYQRICVDVSGTGVDTVTLALCEALYKVDYDWWVEHGKIGPPPTPCTPTYTIVSQLAASAFFKVVQPSPPAPPPTTTTPTTTTTTTTTTPTPPRKPVVMCVVPRLTGLTLSKARTAVSRAHCGLGNVSKPKKVKRHHTLHVVSQSAKPKTIHPKGFRVRITLK